MFQQREAVVSSMLFFFRDCVVSVKIFCRFRSSRLNSRPYVFQKGLRHPKTFSIPYLRSNSFYKMSYLRFSFPKHYYYHYLMFHYKYVQLMKMCVCVYTHPRRRENIAISLMPQSAFPDRWMAGRDRTVCVTVASSLRFRSREVIYE